MSKKQKRHPWDRWFKKDQFTLVQGRDFNCMVHSMGVQVRGAAAARGLYVRVLISNPTVSKGKGNYLSSKGDRILAKLKVFVTKRGPRAGVR